MDKDDLRLLLEETEALLTGHFNLSSGLHSDTYIQCARLLSDPRHAKMVGGSLASMFDASHIDLVAAPAVGGLVIGYAVAEALGVRMIFTERGKGEGKMPMSLRRGFEIMPGERVLVVEDVVTTGGSAAEVAELIVRLGGHIAGVGSVIRRGAASEATSGWKYLLEVTAATWKPGECPLCDAGVPLYSPGSSR